MRKITTRFLCETLTLTILAGALVVPSVQAAELYVFPGCKIDWDGDQMVTQDDYLYGTGGVMDGYYSAWYMYSYTPYFSMFFPDLTMEDIDFNEDGVVDQSDYLGSLDAAAETEGFYDAWYIYSFTPYASIFFPEGTLCTEKPDCASGICATASQYCGPDHILTSESWGYGCPIGLGCCMPEPPCPTGICAVYEFECEPENEWRPESDDYSCAEGTTCCLPKAQCEDEGGVCIDFLSDCVAPLEESQVHFCGNSTKCCI